MHQLASNVSVIITPKIISSRVYTAVEIDYSICSDPLCTSNTTKQETGKSQAKGLRPGDERNLHEALDVKHALHLVIIINLLEAAVFHRLPGSLERIRGQYPYYCWLLICIN